MKTRKTLELRVPSPALSMTGNILASVNGVFNAISRIRDKKLWGKPCSTAAERARIPRPPP